MHAEQEPRALGDGFFVIGDAGAVGGAYLTQSSVRFLHHVGDAERAADFDEFAAGNDDFSVFGQRVERQQNSSRVVVDDDGGCCGSALRRDQTSLVICIRQKPLEKAVDVEVALAS